MSASAPQLRRGLVLLAGALLFALAVVAFYSLATSYGGFLIPQQGIRAIPQLELAFYAWYALFAALGLLLLVPGLRALELEARVQRAFEAACAEPSKLLFALALLAFGVSLAFRRLVLESQPIADDEATYLFIARTLLAGRLVNPRPLDPDYFRNQFVILNEHGWYGKYPIGHPLWLALGELVHARDAIAPLAGALCVPLAYAVGRRMFGPKRALFGCALLVASPHFIWTCATLLSQPTACLALLAGSQQLLYARERDRLGSFALSGLAFGYGILVRPLPGALFAGVAGGCVLLAAARRPRERRTRGLLGALSFGACASFGVLAVLAVNHAQTGSAFTSGYHEVHGNVHFFENRHADLANSFFGALLRENVWLFGLPGALALVLLARPAAGKTLFYGVLGAELAYRLLSPKTVVGSTGPIYLTEAVPFLTLAAADGALRLRDALRARDVRGDLLVPLLAAAALVCATLFVPVELRTLRRGVQLRTLVYRALEHAHASRALVFADTLAFPESGATWAYYPDDPDPALDDPILFVRVPQQDPLRSVHDFWQRRFPERRAFLFIWSQKGEPLFRELRRDE